MKQMDIGLIGLSVMGRNLALNMADHGILVGGYNRHKEVTDNVMRETPHDNLIPFYDLKELVGALKKPRKVFLMIKAGTPVDAVIAQLVPLLEKEDIILDGGNSFFEDTRRRTKELEKFHIHYFGVGVSGGETGARFGPAIMPGGDKEAYTAIQPILEAIAARAEDDGAPCCAYMGPDGAGHYVKMVHNGIEYADMQLIAESYLLLKNIGGFANESLSKIYAKWNEGELRSYLIGITADVFQEKDDLCQGELLDQIEDSAQQKGTGRWASIEALKQGVDISMITGAVDARIISNHLTERAEAFQKITGPKVERDPHPESFIETVRAALYTAKIAAYAQGFALMRDASEQYHWSLELGGIAAVFRAGCIIQAAFLNDITAAFRNEAALENLMLSPFFLNHIEKGQNALRKAVAQGVISGIPLPAMTAALSYLDAYRGAPVGANLIQAQRDYFGAHTYRRIDREGVFHHEWGRANAK